MNRDDNNDPPFAFGDDKIMKRLEALEADIIEIREQLPCNHKYPHDEIEVWDNEQDCEVLRNVCRNCGEEV